MTTQAPVPGGRQPEPSVLVIGGGLAGLAAASALTLRGVRVTLLEARSRLGGRAASFQDPGTGQVVDYCQHVGMGCCTNLAHFCRLVGLGQWMRREPVLAIQDERGRISRLGPASLPAPLHLGPAFLRARFLRAADKLRIGYGLWRLLREPRAPAGWSFGDWLAARRQTPQTIGRFWSTVLASALNQLPDAADYHYARQVFVEGFLAHPDASVLEVPTVPLGELYGTALARWLDQHGVLVRTSTPVEGVIMAEGERRALGCRLRQGETLTADHVILAVPFQEVQELLPDDLRALPEFRGLAELRSTPITSVHLWYDRPVMDGSHLVVIGRTIQWLFRRGAGDYVQAVTSAAWELATLSGSQVLERVLADVHEVLPATQVARRVGQRVITERQATFSAVPGVDRWRPGQRTSIANLWLAGDYTRTGWPATMEGAVRSGYLAAEGVLAASGQPQPLLRPSLPLGLLARILIRR